MPNDVPRFDLLLLIGHICNGQFRPHEHCHLGTYQVGYQQGERGRSSTVTHNDLAIHVELESVGSPV